MTALAGQAGASATIIVDSNADGTADPLHCSDGVSGNCTLRDAAALAVDGDTITFDAGVTAITLSQGIDLRAVTLTGPGSADLTITPLYSVDRMFIVSGTGDATISGLTLVGKPIKSVNRGNFTLDDVTLTGAFQTYGGALYAANSGNLAISNSTFANNGAILGGGAVFAYNSGSVTVANTAIENNTCTGAGGGGLKMSGSVTDVMITSSSITGNTAHFGGGVESFATGRITILDSNISTNTASLAGAGGLLVQTSGDPADMVWIERTTVDGNTTQPGFDGGGMNVTDHSLVMIDSTVSNNHAGNTGGGIAIDRGNSVTINNSTITGNHSRVGGGLYASHMPVTLNQSTIVGNTATDYAGGVWFYTSSLNLSGTIVSGNTAVGASDIGALYGAAINSDHSLVGDVAGLGLSSISVTDLGGTINSPMPGVSALADNGGPTKTMALVPGAPAIDAGPNPVASFSWNGFDQRGTPYVRVSNGTADIGAFEVQAGPPPSSSTTSSSTSSTTSTTSLPTSSTTTAPSTTTTLGVLPTSPSSDEDPMIPTFTG